ncbi:hypothetical protein DU53_10825 [Kosmotoga sp. DU53]|nr:hypothetical protein DU53_10825 [Kosmotoga sp. DU53]
MRLVSTLRVGKPCYALGTNPFGIVTNSFGVVRNHYVVASNCFAVEKTVILEISYPESFLKNEILNQVQDDSQAQDQGPRECESR